MNQSASGAGLAAKAAVQMYTIRDFTSTEEGLAGSLARIAAMGYPAVQFSAVRAMNGAEPKVTARQARAMLDDNGLRCIATHRSWDDLVQRADAEIAFHKTLGCDYVAVGGIPGSYHEAGAGGYRRWAADAARLCARLAPEGIRFGYHNHDFEFERSDEGRKSFYDILIEEGGEQLAFEMDVYWVDHAGVNPMRVIERLHGRLPVIHIKDKEVAEGKPVMAAIGEGNLDWPELIPALEAAGVEWYAVEQDVCRRDPFDCLRSSFEFLKGF